MRGGRERERERENGEEGERGEKRGRWSGCSDAPLETTTEADVRGREGAEQDGALRVDLTIAMEGAGNYAAARRQYRQRATHTAPSPVPCPRCGAIKSQCPGGVPLERARGRHGAR